VTRQESLTLAFCGSSNSSSSSCTKISVKSYVCKVSFTSQRTSGSIGADTVPGEASDNEPDGAVMAPGAAAASDDVRFDD
jgi:hypothetical protein